MTAATGTHTGRLWRVLLAVAVAYAVGALLAFGAFGATSIVVLFLPAGVTLSALVLSPTRHWPWILLTVAAVELAVDASQGLRPTYAWGFALANTAEPLLGAALLRRHVPGPVDLTRRRDLIAFLSCGVVAGPLAGALIGGTTVALGTQRDWLESFLPFWAGDATGALTVGGSVLAWRHRATGDAVARWRWPLILVATVAITAVGFWPQHLPLFYLPIPLLFGVAFTQRLPVTMTAGLAMTVTANYLTSSGHGPWAVLDGPVTMKTATLQLFLAVAILGAGFLAVGVAERDRARSDTDIERAARRRLATVQSLTARLARAPTSQSIARALSGGDLRCTVAFGDASARDAAMAAAARTGRTVTDDARLCVPITDGDGPVLGALAFEHSDDEDLVPFARTVAALTAQALRRAQLYEREVGAARQLQRALLPGLTTEVPGVQVSADYRPADLAHDVGGDWYDVFHLPGRRVGLAVGDVVGHDLAAAAAMARLQATLRVLAQSAAGPAEVLTELDRASGLINGAYMCTVGYADYEPESRLLRYACAGHPPPLLVTTGHSEYLWEGRSMPVAVEPGARKHAEHTVPPGAYLVWYTDGLVENREESMYAGLDRLAAAAERLVADGTGDLCGDLLRELSPDRPAADDTVLLCVRFACR